MGVHTALTIHQLFPHIKGVVDQYKHKIPKDDLKRFAKEVRVQLLSQMYGKADWSESSDCKEACGK